MKEFKLEKGGKRNDDTPQHEAVREAFTNAIIHCDIMADAGILRIEKHDDCLCFRNPGLLKLPVETIYQGGNSKARNPKIQNMLRMIGFGENVGSGFPKIIAAWKETNWGEPKLLNKLDVDEVELVLPVPNISNLSFTTQNVVKDVVKELSDRQRVLVEMLVADPYLSAKVMSEKDRVDERTIQRDLAKLKKLGILSREGGRKDGKWIILKEKL